MFLNFTACEIKFDCHGLNLNEDLSAERKFAIARAAKQS
ncbi:hypothetical protein CAMRE0001_0720 [Campylobacter rectus RM3267]|uniref:Uncharacterized protein n=1 Tax=Campylobacter rectus RM3267 TaxID=553218 RepID=B9CZN0_CAMRE|nr:hypothetical protein CAMRE0001_0720 [Campylobacter rectus RM3267]